MKMLQILNLSLEFKNFLVSSFCENERLQGWKIKLLVLKEGEYVDYHQVIKNLIFLDDN